MSMSLVERIRERVRAQQVNDLPSETMTMVSERPSKPASEMDRVIQQVYDLGKGVPCALYAWILRREEAYWSNHGREWPFRVITYQASMDYLTHTRRLRSA